MSAPVVLLIQPESSDPAGRLGEWLSGAGLGLDVRNAEAGDELPADLTGFAGLVVLGGAAGALDDRAAPWLPAIRSLLRTAVAEQTPTLGVCLGAQLLAVANGGRVAVNPGGPEFGAQLIAKRTAASTDPLFGPVPITPDVLQWHFDAITALPAQALLLAGSPACEVQAFRLGRLAWGIQFHIETTPDQVRDWAHSDADALDGYDVELMLQRVVDLDADIVEVWRPFAQSFAAIVRDPDAVPTARDVRVSTAEAITDPAAIRAALAAELTAARAPQPLAAPRLRERGTEPRR